MWRVDHFYLQTKKKIEKHVFLRSYLLIFLLVNLFFLILLNENVYYYILVPANMYL